MTQADLLFNTVLLVSVTMGVLYAMFLLHRSTPTERQAAQKRFDTALDKAVEKAEQLADETKNTERDDMAVDLLKQLIALSRAGKLEQILDLLPSAPVVTTTTTTSETLYNPAEADRN